MTASFSTRALQALSVAGLALAAACAPDTTSPVALRDASAPTRWENEDSNGYLVLCKTGTPVGTYKFQLAMTGGGPGVELLFGNAFSLTTASTGDDCKWVWRDWYLEGGNSTVTITEEPGADYEVKSWTLYAGATHNGGFGAEIPAGKQLGGQSYTITLAPTDWRYLVIENTPKAPEPKCEDPTAKNPGGPLPCVYPLPAALGDLVWNDLNRDGIQDGGESGIAGVTVNLFKCDGTPMGTTTTNATGIYGFSNLAAGSYKVEFVKPSNLRSSPADQGANDAADSDANPTTGFTGCYTLAEGQTNLTIDAGMHAPAPAALGDFVWNDMNKNGIQDGGEPGIPGVTVNLYVCEGTTPIGTTTTNASGIYGFGNLAAGSYKVQFGAPVNYQRSPANQGANDAADSDASATTGFTGCYTLAEGQTNLTIDAGMFYVPPYSLGTATGFGPQWPNSSNWFMYTPYGTSKVDLVSGAKFTDVGDIFMSRTSTTTTIRITLHAGTSWDAVADVIKIHPMAAAPSAYLEPGKFQYHFSAPNLSNLAGATVSFAGQTATITIPGTTAKFYGIHVDVRIAE